MAKVVADADKSFDRRVVEILQRRYIELEKLANEHPLEVPAKLSTDIKVQRGSAPAAGFATSSDAESKISTPNADLGAAISAARIAGGEIIKLSRQSAAVLRVDDILSLLAVRVTRLVAHDSLAIYRPEDDGLVPALVSGENFRLFSSLRIPLGEGLSGWVAQNHKAIVNGNPSVEPGYLNDPKKYCALRSALAVPLEGASGIAAVLALYRAGQDSFTPEDLCVVEALASGLGLAIERATKPKAAATCAGAG